MISIPPSFHELCRELRDQIIQTHQKNQRLKTTLTGQAEWITDLDIYVDQTIRSYLHATFPSIPVISEETTSQSTIHEAYDAFFTLDPIDGTRELIKGTGDFAFALAYIETGQPQTCAVYFPMRDEYYYTDPSTPPQCNQQQILFPEYSPCIVLATRIDRWENIESLLDMLKKQLPALSFYYKGAAVTKVVEVILGYAAAYFYLPHPTEKAKIWDVAAAHGLAERLGLVVTDAWNQPISYQSYCLTMDQGFVASHPYIASQVREVIEAFLRTHI
jgi:3'(2'), 5'-bisphosphate nucleotidase